MLFLNINTITYGCNHHIYYKPYQISSLIHSEKHKKMPFLIVNTIGYRYGSNHHIYFKPFQQSNTLIIRQKKQGCFITINQKKVNTYTTMKKVPISTADLITPSNKGSVKKQT